MLKFLERTGWREKEATADYTTYELAAGLIPDRIEGIDFYYQAPLKHESPAGAAALKTTGVQAAPVAEPVPIETPSKLEKSWEVELAGGANLLHRSYLLPLKNHTAWLLLRLPVQEGSSSRAEYVPPRNETDKKIVGIWEEMLQVERIGIFDNFFKLGGHSLKATSLIGRLHQEYQLEIPLQQIFLTPTVASLTDYLVKATAAVDEQHSVPAAQKQLMINEPEIKGNGLLERDPKVW